MAEGKKIKTRKINKESRTVETISKKDNTEKKVRMKKSGVKPVKIKTRKIRNVDFNREELKNDKRIENEENLSVAIMILILVICFAVGIFLGYLLYNLAINSSNAAMIVRYFGI